MTRDAPAPADDSEDASFRSRILAVSTTLFIRDGYNAVSFLGIAKELGTGHSRIHYYFRTKAMLAEAALDLYARAAKADFQAIWTDPEYDLRTRFVLSRDWIHRRYIAFNPGGTGAHNWGLLARFAGEAESMGPGVRKMLRTTLDDMDAYIKRGIDLAVAAGELGPATPKRSLMLQISSLLHTSLNLTRFDGSFGRLDELLRWTLDVTLCAYGPAGAEGHWPPLAEPPQLAPGPPV